MSRFASAPWPLKAAYAAALTAGGGGLLTGLAAIVALAGLHRLSPPLDPSAIAAWFWYFRADPTVRRWLADGALSALLCGGLILVAILRSLKPPLHGAARWASEAELRTAGLRARQGILLGRRD